MVTSFDVYRNGRYIDTFTFNYDVAPQKVRDDMETRDGFEGPLTVVKKPMIKTGNK